MPTRVTIIYRIIIAIAIEVQAVGGFGVQVGGVIRRDKSPPFRRIVPGVAVVQAGVICTILATGRKRVLWRSLLRHTYFTIFPAHSQEKASQTVMIWEVVFIIEYMEHYSCNIAIFVFIFLFVQYSRKM